MNKLRLFFAVDLPGNLKDKLLAFSSSFREVPNIRWTKKENLHLTILFLGYLNEELLPTILKVAGDVFKTCQKFVLSFENIVPGPIGNYPRMIWANLEPNPILQKLKIDLENALLKAGVNFKKENRSMRLHITLARFSPQKIAEEKIDFSEKLEVNEILLMQSFLSPRGPEYLCLNRFPLY